MDSNDSQSTLRSQRPEDLSRTEKGVNPRNEGELDGMKELGDDQQQRSQADAEKKLGTTPSGPPSTAAADPPPDGGLTAWLQVLGSWMMIFNTWGTPSPPWFSFPSST